MAMKPDINRYNWKQSIATQDGHCDACDVMRSPLFLDGIAWMCCDKCGVATAWGGSRCYRNDDAEHRRQAIESLQHYLLICPIEHVWMEPPQRDIPCNVGYCNLPYPLDEDLRQEVATRG